MLVLKRKRGESIVLFDSESKTKVTVRVERFGKKACRLVVEAPRNVAVLRDELLTGGSHAQRTQ